VTIALRSYVEDDIRAGRLAAPFPLAVPKGQAWYIVYRPYRHDDPGLIAFRRWVCDQFKREPER
jgi:DNA-binding transcriptional LysR family regulator